MTQKEYKENISKLENKIKEQEEEIRNLEVDTVNYKGTLETNAELSGENRRLYQENGYLQNKINELEEIINHYKDILTRVEINIEH